MSTFNLRSALLLAVFVHLFVTGFSNEVFDQGVEVMGHKYNGRCAVATVDQRHMLVKYQCTSETGEVAALTGMRCLEASACKPYMFMVCHEPGWKDCDEVSFFPPGNLPAEQVVSTIRSMIYEL